MKQIKRLICVVLVLCMLALCSVFAATAPAPSVSIVSPVENSIVANDSLLVSVKVLDKKKISVTVFEEKLNQLGADEKPVLDKDGKEVLLSLAVKDFKEENFEEVKAVYEAKKFVDVPVADPAVFTAVGEVGYFTKTLEKLTPGLYRIKIDVLGKDDVVTESYNSFVALQEKPAETTTSAGTEKTDTKTVTVETQKASLLQTFVKFIKSIIK